MIVAGIMSGTSADGIDVALVRIPSPGNGFPKLDLLIHQTIPYPAALRKAVLAAMSSKTTSTAQLARLHWRLGIAYAEAVWLVLAQNPMKIDLIGCHGQTLYHQSDEKPFAGARFACTWQAGESAILAGEFGVPVISNFRPADMVAGGHGAPLVPLLDFAQFRHSKRGRILQNIGGIANMTVIPAAVAMEQALAFDSGPGNMVIDELMLRLYGKQMDVDGAVAASGKVLPTVLKRALSHSFFRKKPPKTAGREQFGKEFTSAFLRDCKKASSYGQDAIATATALTAESIASAYRRFVAAKMLSNPIDYIVSGGGARNATLMRQLSERLKEYNCTVSTSDRFGLPAEAKEAAAFALLAWQTWHHRPGNLPSATGAGRPVILGQVTYA